MKKDLNFWAKLPKPILALAPMCGVTDLPFRLMSHKYGADVVYTEMIMIQALAYKGKKTLQLAKLAKQERPVVLQLSGNDPELFYKAAKIVSEEIKPSGIDINLGCPAKKVAGHGSGIALLRDLDKTRKIIEATIKGANGLPVSIKTRTQITDKSASGGGKITTSLELLDKIKDLPIAAVMIHGRSYEAPWIAEVDYQYIREARKHYKGIILANGGIYEPEIAGKALKISHADGLGIAHGVYGRPWIFNQIKDYLKTKKYTKPTWPEIRKIAIEHAKLSYKYKGEHGLIELRKQLLWYVKGLPNATDLRSKLVRLKTLKEIIETLKKIK